MEATVTEPLVSEDLLRYFAIRSDQRVRQAAATLGALNPRERRLVREAAVMGFVRGTMHVPGHHDVAIPPDAAVLELVTNCCLSMPDLHPEFNRASRRAARREVRNA
jgi:hypothetical protein